MDGLPVILRLQGRLCIVVGGGGVGRRKAESLLRAGARVRLIDPAGAALPAGCEPIARAYRSGDLAGAVLAFAATSDRQVNAAVAAEARALGIPVNVADRPEEGDFLLTAQLRRGELTVAVSTGGESPGLAAAIRDRLASVLGPEWAQVVEIAAALRQNKLTLTPETEYNSQILHRLLERGLPSLLAAGAAAEVDRLLAEIAGTSLASLGICLPKGES